MSKTTTEEPRMSPKIRQMPSGKWGVNYQDKNGILGSRYFGTREAAEKFAAKHP